jgi:hypothetical protein
LAGHRLRILGDPLAGAGRASPEAHRAGQVTFKPSLQASSAAHEAVILNPIFLRSILKLSSYLRVDIPSGLSSSGFKNKILYAFFIPRIRYMSNPSHPP